MRLELVKKPVGEWASFNEHCGIGDGVTKEFKTPIPAAEARSILVLRGFGLVSPDDHVVVTNDKDGTILKDEPDGYKLETRGEDVYIIFDRAPALDTYVSVSGLGRKVGDAFCILPMSTLLQKKIQEKQPAIFRGPIKDRDKVTNSDLQEAGRVSFDMLVVDWTGMEGENGPLACDAESKKQFLDRFDAMFFGLFVSNRAAAIRDERIRSFSKDSSD